MSTLYNIYICHICVWLCVKTYPKPRSLGCPPTRWKVALSWILSLQHQHLQQHTNKPTTSTPTNQPNKQWQPHTKQNKCSTQPPLHLQYPMLTHLVVITTFGCWHTPLTKCFMNHLRSVGSTVSFKVVATLPPTSSKSHGHASDDAVGIAAVEVHGRKICTVVHHHHEAPPASGTNGES